MNNSYTLRIFLPAFVLLTLSFGSLKAQNPLDGMPDSTTYVGITWKSNADIAPTLIAERTRVNNLLTNPSLPATDKAILAAYGMMIDNIQENLNASNSGTFADIAITSFNKVLEFAPSDPVLKYLHPGLFKMQFDLLLEQLAEPHQPHAFPVH